MSLFILSFVILLMETIIHYKRLKRKKACSKKARFTLFPFFHINGFFIAKTPLKCYNFPILSII